MFIQHHTRYRSRSRRLRPTRFAAAFAMLILAGCGYQHTPVYPADVHTVTVPIFHNRTFYRGAERDLTEALIKEIELRTPYKVVGFTSADTIIQGTITSIEQTRLSRRSNSGVPEQMELTITVNVEWNDVRTGKTRRHRQGLKAVGRYVPARSNAETFDTAQHRAAANIAGKIVSSMATDW